MPALGSLPYEVVGERGIRAVWNDTGDPDYIGRLDPENGVSGLLEADIRLEGEDNVDADGGTLPDGLRGRMPFTITGTIENDLPLTSVLMLEAKAKRAHLAKRADGYLYWTDPADGFRKMVRWRTAQAPRITGRRPKQATFQLESASHRAYSASLLSAACDAGGLVFCANSGDTAAPARYRVHGPLNTFVITDDLGNNIVSTYNLAAGHYIDLDTANTTAYIDGTLFDLITTVVDTDWPEVESPGTQFTIGSFVSPVVAGSLEVFWRHAWEN